MRYTLMLAVAVVVVGSGCDRATTPPADPTPTPAYVVRPVTRATTDGRGCIVAGTARVLPKAWECPETDHAQDRR